MNTCPPCGRPVNDGYLCHGCTATLRETVRQAPQWADQLGLVLARLTRYTDPGARRGADRPLPYNPAASDPARRLDAAVRGCVAVLPCPLDVAHARLGVLCAWLADNVGTLRLLPDAPRWEHRISKAVEAAIAVSDRPPEQWYAGRCDCGLDLYPSSADKVVTCVCGATWPVQERRDSLLAQVREVVAPAPAIVRALPTLGTKPLTLDNLRKWRHRGKLTPRGMTSGPRPANKYRVGDVLDLMTKERK